MERAARVRARFIHECRTVARTRAGRRRASERGPACRRRRGGGPRAVRDGARPHRPGRRCRDGRRVDGAGDLRVATTAPSASRLQTGAAIREGDRIETGWRAESACASQGARRFDHATAARLVSAGRWSFLLAPSYVDSGPASPGLEVRTPLASVRDIGTQFEVRSQASALRVRVRSGLVEVQRGRDMSSARPGTELTVDSRGVTSRDILAHGPDWEWAARLAPAFAIEGRPR